MSSSFSSVLCCKAWLDRAFADGGGTSATTYAETGGRRAAGFDASILQLRAHALGLVCLFH